MNSPVESLEYLQNELTRYKEQKKALEQLTYPKDQEESKQLLLKFYTEQIVSIQHRVDTAKAKHIEVKNPIEVSNSSRKYCETRSKYLGHQYSGDQTATSNITIN